MVSTEVSKDIDHIRKDIASLRQDIVSLTASVKNVAAARGHEAMGRIEELGDRTKVRAEDIKHSAERGIGEHPFTSVLSSFGLGFVLGMVFDPKR